MPNERFSLALSLIGPGDWRYFERLAAEFNAVEFPSLRTMAAMQGDRGRDAELFVPEEEPAVAFQYSVTQDWRGKIAETVTTLRRNFHGVRQLVYCTNQIIGPAADGLKSDLRKSGMTLDTRDSGWFVERELTHPQRAAASEEVCLRFIGDLLQRRGIASRVAPALSTEDARVALLHLSLEGFDRETERGLTKSAFEALVRSVLHDTSSEFTLSASEVVGKVLDLVPSGDRTQVAQQAEGALRRLSVKHGPVKHISKTGAYHLSFDEQRRISEKTAQFLLEDEQLDEEIEESLRSISIDCTAQQTAELLRITKRAIENLLMLRGEEFVAAVATGQIGVIDLEDATRAVETVRVGDVSDAVIGSVVLSILERPGPAVRRHLRQLADGYTLFAFLRETPDVQNVVLRVFQDGDIWIDANVILPILAETLIDVAEQRQFTNLLIAARDAGMRLYVTQGVVEEVLAHINLCIAFSRTPSSEWTSRVPFLYAAYAWSGSARAQFSSWAAGLRSEVAPEDDIEQVLAEDYGVEVRDLREHAERAPLELRAAVQEVWEEARERRQARRHEAPSPNAHRLVAHDVENYVGVMQLRRASRLGPMGFREWWLTLDRIAFTLNGEISRRVAGPTPPSPALSPDFLVELLRLGPLRAAIERRVHVSLPIMAGVARFENVSMDLIDLADRVRAQMEGTAERTIAWQVRDALNAARWRLGAIARGGIGGAEEDIRTRLTRDGRPPREPQR